MDRRQRLLGRRDCDDRSGMRAGHWRAFPRKRGKGRSAHGSFALLLITIAGPAFAADIPVTERRSGYEFMGPQTRAMQDDETSNPGMLGVLDGAAAWARKVGTAQRACADCHGDAS